MSRGVQNASACILVVEDSTVARELTAIVLEAAGYAVDVVGSGAEAIGAVQASTYDLVLMDLGLPDMDGYAAGAALRQMPYGGDRLPVVALTARTGSEEAARCRSAGLDGYMTKPFQAPKLLDEIRRWVAPCAIPPIQVGSEPIWDRSAYREIADRLGPTRTETALEMFEAHVVASLAIIRAAPDDADLLGREVHAFVAIAGMLGFGELSRMSRLIMTHEGDSSKAPSVDDLTCAAERALACLRQTPHSALS